VSRENECNRNEIVSRVETGGQLSILSDIPEIIQKTRGPVIESIISAPALEDITINDTYEKQASPLPIHTRFLVQYPDFEADVNGRPISITAFDREVIDAVTSLIPYNTFITPQMIYRLMMGKREYQAVTPQQVARVEESMRKCHMAEITIDITDIAEKESPIGAQLKKDGLEARYSGHLIAFETVIVAARRGGERLVTHYKILTPPVIARYAQSIGKISYFPIELLDTNLNKTERIILLQSFLLRKIDEMHRGESSLTIETYDIYKSVDGLDAGNTVKKRFRNAVEVILAHWIEKNYIKGYSIRWVGKVIKAYEIQLLPNQKQLLPQNK
jgi:hypothetical protein